MLIRFFAKDNTRLGQVDITALLDQGFRPRFINSSGQFAIEADRKMAKIVREGLAHEETLKEPERLTLVAILKAIAAEAVQPPDELAEGSTDFHVTEARITEARDAIAASEAPPP